MRKGIIAAFPVLLVASFFPSLVAAQQDIRITSGTNPYLLLGRNLRWGATGSGAIENNYIFTPISPNEGFCLFVQNNNPTFDRGVTVAVYQAGDPGAKNYIGFPQKWDNVPTTTPMPLVVLHNSTSSVAYKATASAGITVVLSGTNGGGGSTDTADVYVVQTEQSSCGSVAVGAVSGVYKQNVGLGTGDLFPVLVGGTNFPAVGGTVQTLGLGFSGGILLQGSNNQPMYAQGMTTPQNYAYEWCYQTTTSAKACLMAVSPQAAFGNGGVTEGFVRNNILEVSTQLMNFTAAGTFGYWLQNKMTNPAANATLLHIYSLAAANNTIAYKNLTLSCSAACELVVSRTTTQGTTCSVLTPHNLNMYGFTRKAPATGIGAEAGCTVAPTQSDVLLDLSLGPDQPFVADLSGFITSNGSGTVAGVMVQPVAGFTGFASASLSYVEEP
jgi:hypothetical protein